MERVTSLVCIVAGLYWAYRGWFDYGFWANRGPGAGFIPVLAGIFTASLSCVALMRAPKVSWSALGTTPFYPAIAIFIALLAMKFLGMIIITFIITAGWLKFMAKYSLPVSCLIGLTTTGFVYVVFKIWLGTPLPVGILGI